MPIWIRTQDKERLVEVDEFVIRDSKGHLVDKRFESIITDSNGCVLGAYKNKQIALSVIDDIAIKIYDGNRFMNSLSSQFGRIGGNIFEMPD